MAKEDTQFKPGHAGGPGRPASIQLAARRALEAIANACTDTAMSEMAIALVDQARLGDQRAIEILLDRIVGKPKQTVDATVISQFKAYLGFNPDDDATDVDRDA